MEQQIFTQGITWMYYKLTIFLYFWNNPKQCIPQSTNQPPIVFLVPLKLISNGKNNNYASLSSVYSELYIYM